MQALGLPKLKEYTCIVIHHPTGDGAGGRGGGVGEKGEKTKYTGELFLVFLKVGDGEGWVRENPPAGSDEQRQNDSTHSSRPRIRSVQATVFVPERRWRFWWQARIWQEWA